jgi:hypothetical protein
VDIKSGQSAALEALVTPRWGVPTRFEATQTPSSIQLTGQSTYGEDGTTDTWTTIRLDLDVSGNLTGSFAATGTEVTSNGDVVGQGTLTATGTVTKDLLAPEARVATVSPMGPPDRLLPWDPVIGTLAEPVTSGPVVGGFALTASGGAPVVLFSATHDVPAPFTGFFRSDGFRFNYEPVGAVTLTWDTALADYVPHLLQSPRVTVPFLDLPIATASHSLDGDVVTVGSWGDVTFLGSKAPDPSCETGGCARLGSFVDSYCGSLTPRIGLAARVVSTNATSLAIRYRVLTQDLGVQPTIPPAFTIQTATPDTTATKLTAVQPKSTDFTKTTISGTAVWATEWLTAKVPLAVAPETGVALVGGSGPSSGGCGLVPASPLVTVLVDSIAAE